MSPVLSVMLGSLPPPMNLHSVPLFTNRPIISSPSIQHTSVLWTTSNHTSLLQLAAPNLPLGPNQVGVPQLFLPVLSPAAEPFPHKLVGKDQIRPIRKASSRQCGLDQPARRYPGFIPYPLTRELEAATA